MAKLKALAAVVILSGAVATPVFAESTHHDRAYHHRNFHRAYGHLNAPFFANPQTEGRNMEDFGFSGRDLSVPGGGDPSLNPPAN